MTNLYHWSSSLLEPMHAPWNPESLEFLCQISIDQGTEFTAVKVLNLLQWKCLILGTWSSTKWTLKSKSYDMCDLLCWTISMVWICRLEFWFWFMTSNYVNKSEFTKACDFGFTVAKLKPH